MKLLIASLLFIGTCCAQEAKIMIVERSDSQRLTKAYREYKDALKRWEDVKIEVAKTYTYENGKAITGWEKIQFSADFRALVPQSSQYSGPLHYCNGSSWFTGTGTTAIPVTGQITSVSAGSPITTSGELSPIIPNNAGVVTITDSDVNSDLFVKEK